MKAELGDENKSSDDDSGDQDLDSLNDSIDSEFLDYKYDRVEQKRKDQERELNKELYGDDYKESI